MCTHDLILGFCLEYKCKNQWRNKKSTTFWDDTKQSGGLQDHMATYPEIQYSSQSSPWQTQTEQWKNILN